MADLYVFATVGATSERLWRFPNQNGDLWEFQPATMGYIDVYRHHTDGSHSYHLSIRADIQTLTGVRA